MSKNSVEFKIWKRNWLSISSEKSIYNNKIPFKNEMLEPDICQGDVVVNFIAPPVNMKEIRLQTNLYYLLGYKVYWVINLVSDYQRKRFMVVRNGRSEILFEYAYTYNNILNNMATILDKCDVYFEIDDEHPLYKLKKNTHECYFLVNKKECVTKLEFISNLVFRYRTINM